MANAVPYRITEIFTKWQAAMKESCGDNVSMDTVQTMASFPGATFYFMGFPKKDGDLEGDEVSVAVSVQVDIYTKGQKALSQVYEIDAESHVALIGMGFYRTYGPELMTNTDNSIKRLTSRYSTLLTADGL